jgi:O-succinylbenzoate synthase
MRIETIELREIQLRLRERFEISSGAMQDRRVLLVRLQGGGTEAWGECVAAESPGYSYETVDTAWTVLTDYLVPRVLDRDLEDARDLLSGAPWVRGHRMAKAGLEMAGWGLEARRRGVGLVELLGAERRPVPVGVSIGIQPSNEALVEKIRGYVDEGYARIKIKIKPGRDVEMLQAARSAFPDTPLMADANSAYTLEDVSRLKALDELGLMMIEQPLGYDDLLQHSRLQAQLDTPICLDESIRSVGDAELALEIDAGRIINIKPGRVGGFASSRTIHDLCVERGVPVWCGGMLESGVGRAYNVALATLPGFVLPGDISASRRYWEEDIVEPEFVVEDGAMAPPEGPGIGVRLKRDMVEALTQRVEVYGR